MGKSPHAAMTPCVPSNSVIGDQTDIGGLGRKISLYYWFINDHEPALLHPCFDEMRILIAIIFCLAGRNNRSRYFALASGDTELKSCVGNFAQHREGLVIRE